MSMPFSVIFSLFLIIIFIAVAFYAIKHFMKIKCTSEFGMFIEDFRDDVDKAWKSQASDFTFKGSGLGSRIEYVCFANLSERQTANVIDSKGRDVFIELRKNSNYKDNMFFYPRRYACIASAYIAHIKFDENPMCIAVKDGTAEIRIRKGFYDSLVTISRP